MVLTDSQDPEWFNDDENFSDVMQQTLHLQHAVVSQIHKLNVDHPEVTLPRLAEPIEHHYLTDKCR